jgi:glucan phosphoethanolaminetransferase (alkaline phosphatase superfamily)
MIQRIQSIWLLLASAAAFSVLRFPFYYTPTPFALEINGSSQYSTLISLAFSACLSVITIFLYGNRMLQLKVVLVNFLLSILIGYFIYTIVMTNSGGGFTLTSIALFIIPIFQVLAMIKIYQDDKLVKSTDRLR